MAKAFSVKNHFSFRRMPLFFFHLSFLLLFFFYWLSTKSEPWLWFHLQNTVSYKRVHHWNETIFCLGGLVQGLKEFNNAWLEKLRSTLMVINLKSPIQFRKWDWSCDFTHRTYSFLSSSLLLSSIRSKMILVGQVFFTHKVTYPASVYFFLHNALCVSCTRAQHQ